MTDVEMENAAEQEHPQVAFESDSQELPQDVKLEENGESQNADEVMDDSQPQQPVRSLHRFIDLCKNHCVRFQNALEGDETYNALLAKKLSAPVAQELTQLFNELSLTLDDFDDRACELLATFSAEQAKFIIKEIKVCDSVMLTSHCN